jgi:predicted CXXCH cytochrome family protein
MKTLGNISLVIVLMSAFFACTKETINGPGGSESLYAGSAVCKTCHGEIYDRTEGTPMYHALTLVEDGAPPSVPPGFVDLLPPDDYTWSDLAFVIGGTTWSANFIAQTGYVVTQVHGSQFNVADLSRVPYKPEVEDGTQEFDCGACHTTGWGLVEDDYSPNYIETFPEKYYEEGVRCEACHGPGAAHAGSGSEAAIEVDRSSELCAKCHQMNEDNSIVAEGNFIAIGQQYEEWFSSPHRQGDISCVDCHDPHASAVHEAAPGDGVKECSSCHADKNADKHFAMEIDCKVCHMPKSLKVALEENAYTGDASTHIFKISTDATYFMFSEDGQVNKDGNGLSLDYVCYQCHKDESGAGGKFSKRSMEALSQKAQNFHD